MKTPLALAPAAVLVVLPADDWWDHLNPFTYLGNAAGKVAADAWTAAMLGLWNAGLWLLKLVLNIEDAFLTPDLSEGGPGRAVYQATFWIAGALLLMMLMIQLGIAAFRRDGASLARAVIGSAQFVMVWAAWIGMAVAILAACGGLTRALLQGLLHVDAMSAWQPFAGFSTKDITDGTIATVLGVMGIFLVFAAIGHALVMLTRAGALMILAATAPVSAAGLVSEVGRSWFWKSLRWFIAAAFTPVLMAMVLGVGVQMTSGVVTGMTEDLAKAVGTAVPGVLLILIGCFTPLALFKLLAFVDPGTSSGAAMRRGLDAQGGLSGLLRGDGGASDTSDAASTSDASGRSQAESAGEDATGSRFRSGMGSALSALGPIGAGVAAGMQTAGNTATRAAAIGADLTNQMGVGSPSYIPDFTTTRRGGSRGSSSGPSDNDNPDTNGSGTPATPPSPPSPPPPAGAPNVGGGQGAPAGGGSPAPAGAGAAAGGASGAEAAAVVL